MRRWAASVLFLASPTRPLDVGRRDFLATISAATQTQWTPTALPHLSLDQAATRDRLDFARYPDPILRLEAKPVRRFDAALAKNVTLIAPVPDAQETPESERGTPSSGARISKRRKGVL